MQLSEQSRDKSSPHQMRLKPRIALEASLATASLSQYLCGTAHPDSEHVVCDVKIRDARGQLKTARALIDCGATSIFVSPQLLERLGLERLTVPAYTTTQSIDGKVIMNARESRKIGLNIQYFDYLAGITENDCLVVPMQAYDLVLGIPWFKARDPEIDWQHIRLLCIRTPYRQIQTQTRDRRCAPAGSVLSSQDDHFSSPSTIRGENTLDPLPMPVEVSGNGRAIKIEMLSATSMGQFLGVEDCANTFILKLNSLDKGDVGTVGKHEPRTSKRVGTCRPIGQGAATVEGYAGVLNSL